jgi:hypothetical protein
MRTNFDEFGICPKCRKWSLRVRTTVDGNYQRDSLVYLLPDAYFFDFRCLKCGYRHKEAEIQPLMEAECIIKAILESEAKRIIQGEPFYPLYKVLRNGHAPKEPLL